MSRQFINEYRAELDRLRAVSGSRREGVLSEAFKDLLKRWGRSKDLIFNAQHEIITQRGTPWDHQPESQASRVGMSRTRTKRACDRGATTLPSPHDGEPGIPNIAI